MLGFGIASVLIAHIAADFYGQSDRMAEAKASDVRALVAHCVLYALVFGFCVVLLSSGPSLGWVIFVGCVGHAGIDIAKYRLMRKFEISELKMFCLDQAIHVLLNIAVVSICVSGLHPSLFADWVRESLGEAVFARAMELLLAFLIVGKPSIIFVSLVLDRMGDRSGGEADGALMKAGRWIGVLERAIVVAMTLWGEFEAIAFVLTAKSIARFDLLKDQNFAERYLVGTLASTAIAILAALLVSGLLG